MIVLGISCYYHDAGAAIVRDGQLVAAAEEERFNRTKHYSGFPKQAIEFCLREAGVTLEQVDHIGFYEKPLVKFNRILETILATWPLSFNVWRTAIPTWVLDKLHIGRHIQQQLDTDRDILFCQHHLAHAGSAFLVSPFDKAAIITADGVGEWVTTGWGVGDGVTMDFRQEIRFPHSIGLLFSAITAYLGFRVNDAEWKVMGLAPYGKPIYVDKFREVVDIREDGSFRLNLKYFSFPYSTSRTISPAWERLFGQPQRRPETDLSQFHNDIAHSGQKIVEEIMVRIARHAQRESGLKQVCIAGGVGLNCVANWRILRECGFDDIYIQPAAGDSGGALGTAFYIANSVMKAPRAFSMDHAYWGPAFSNAEVRAALDDAGANYELCESDDELINETAQRLAKGGVIGWFQGRMEFGPRALGSRSLLADPRRADMKDIINAKVKFREAFRPFAPAVLKERAHEFFEMPEGMDAPFMLLVPSVRPEARAQIPAVTHQDGTGRVQTVTPEHNPLYYGVIKRFGELTGVPVLINTSFNVRGEPIVCTPADAYRTFVNTGIDTLVIGRCIVSEKPSQVDFERGMRRSVALEAKPL
ncbi:MAG: carbamoyltransferase [Phycisphaerales bacterium]|nr:carbamoyltransferase [Phycisphaerales bacterium]